MEALNAFILNVTNDGNRVLMLDYAKNNKYSYVMRLMKRHHLPKDQFHGTFKRFCSIEWQDDEIEKEMFNVYRGICTKRIVKALQIVMRAPLTLFKCWFAQFSDQLAQVTYLGFNHDNFNYIQNVKPELINVTRCIIDAVCYGDIYIYDYYEKDITDETFNGDLPITIGSIDALSSLYNKCRPLNISLRQSLRYMDYDIRAYYMLYMMGIFHKASTVELLDTILYCGNQDMVIILEQIFEPHLLLYTPISKDYEIRYKWRTLSKYYLSTFWHSD